MNREGDMQAGAEAKGWTAESFLVLVSVAISSLILAMGVWLLTGWFLDDLWPSNVRYAAGSVMALYGVYRIATSRSRYRALASRDRIDREGGDDDGAR